jgi:hypothetical protein
MPWMTIAWLLRVTSLVLFQMFAAFAKLASLMVK